MDTHHVSSEFFDRDNLERLARKPDTEVYEYVHDEVDAKDVEPSRDVCEWAQYIHGAVPALLRANPGWGRMEVRAHMLAQSENFVRLSRAMPRVFDTCCDPDTSAEAFRRLMFLIYMRERQEKGMVSEELAAFSVNQFLITEFRTDNKAGPAVARLDDSAGDDDSAAAVPRASF